MKTLQKLLILGVVAAAACSCTLNFEEINTNPNRTVVGMISPYGMFEPILYWGGTNWQEDTWYYNNELIQFTAHTGGVTRKEHQYHLEESRDWGGQWNFYSRYANNTDHMYELAVEHNDKALQAIALTFKVLFMSNLTDMFGDIPYKEAFTGRKVGGTMTPAFESQKDVYEDMFADLEAANDIYATNPAFQKPSMDGMYAGNMAKWRKFNNSLYLRLLCRVSGRSEMKAGEKIAAIMNDPTTYPVFTSNADNATVKYAGVDPYNANFGTETESGFTSSGRKLTEQLIKMTVVAGSDGKETYVDPRLPIIGKKNTNKQVNPDNIWKGTVSGCEDMVQNQVDKGTSWLNWKVFCRKDAPAYFMDYSELLFIYAEMAQKGVISGSAQTYYEQAITATMQKWSEQGAYSETPTSISAADITTYLASPLGAWSASSNKLELIANQKYLSLFWVGMEAYHEWRRTEYPTLTIGEGTAVYNDKILPTRFGYPNTTVSTNKANVETALARMGGANDMKTPVWWSKKAIESGK